MTKQDPVEGRQRETNLEIRTKQDPVEGRQRGEDKHDETRSSRRETKGDKPGNHVVTKSVSLQELRTPSAEAVWGTKVLCSTSNQGFSNEFVKSSLLWVGSNGAVLSSACGRSTIIWTIVSFRLNSNKKMWQTGTAKSGQSQEKL